jgi:hypothetical protein
MIISLTASADTYITNKIVDGQARIFSNVGKAGTLDLFKLYDETEQSNSLELSRILLKFNLDYLNFFTSSILNLNNLNAVLKLKPIVLGNPCPNNFTISVFPLAQEFTEGLGRDVISFADLDISNYITASLNSSWFLSGCSQGGLSGSSNIDYITHADFGTGLISLESKQYFDIGSENLEIDVTNIVSASLCNKLSNFGFRVAYSASDEASSTSLFVKRFASRHVKNKLLVPTLEIRFDDSRIDQKESLFFDEIGNVFLISKNSTSYVNLKDLGGNELTGSNCILLGLSTGSFSINFTGSQEILGEKITGIYKAPILISSNDVSIVSGTKTLSEYILENDSISFNASWKTLNGLKTFKNEIIDIKSLILTDAVSARSKVIVRCDGPREVTQSDIIFIRSLFYDIAPEEIAYKFSYEREALKLPRVLYRIRDVQTDTLICDFNNNFTKLSLDSIGNYFNISATSLPLDAPLTFEFLVNYNGDEKIIFDSNYILKVKV